MPRSGSGVYTLPAGSLVANGDVSDASDLNTPISDLEADANLPRPIVAGGTGASTAAGALANLTAGLAGNGFVVRTSPSANANRTITAGSGIAVTNGDGVSGNPTIAFNRGAPIIKTLNFTVGDNENWLAINSGTSLIVTLPAASSWAGREIMFQNYQAQLVTSASNNVVPQNGAVPGSALLPPVIGSWVVLVSNGTAWVVTQSSVPSFASGQVWTDVGGSRSIGVNYTNATGRPIQVSVRMTLTATTGPGSATLTVGGVTVAVTTLGESSGAGWNATAQTLSAIIPPGSAYSVTGANATIQGWSELR